MCNLDEIREERAKWFEWKNIKRIQVALKNIHNIDFDNLNISYGAWVTAKADTPL